MSLEYIRRYYGVPAKRGAIVEYEGQRGVVTGASGHYIRVRLDDQKHSRIYHPANVNWINESSESSA